MVVIDVNSGRYAARREQELNSLKTNLEAAREISRQLRLRDIGGIIVVDFIDMNEERNKKKVYDEMKKEFRKDRAKSSILPLTEFGLMQITRQRIRQSIVQALSEKCPVCAGTGMLVSKTTIIKQIERWLERFRAESGERRLVLSVHPTLGDMLKSGLMSPLRHLQMSYFVRIKLELDEALTGDDFRFYSPKQKKDITEEFSSGAESTDRPYTDEEDDLGESRISHVEDAPVSSGGLQLKRKNDLPEAPEHDTHGAPTNNRRGQREQRGGGRRESRDRGRK
jgi:ribonuclease G